MTARTFLLLAVTAPAVAGCVVGPDFRRPETPATNRYTPEPLPDRTASAPVEGGAAQHFVAAKDIPAQWWTLFRSEALDRLVREALTQSPSLAAAEARLRQAQELLRAETGAVYYPAIAADAAASRQRRSVAGLGIPGISGGVFNLYHVSVSVSYALDTAGGLRRQIEALQAQVDFEAYQREAAYLALAGNVVTAAVTEASLRAQMRATEEILAGIENQLAIAEKQLAIGAIARTDVLTQRAEAAQVRATLPALERQLAAVRHQLAVLLGRLPSAADFPEFTLAALELPTELPLTLPSALVRQRPDVRAAEALLHAASAQIGVATANLYPQIALSAAYGTEATETDELFDGDTRFWSIGASLLQPFFNGGELRARRRAAIAAFDAAAAQYRQTVLAAFQDVADVLRALETDARALLEQQRAFAAAEEALALVRRQYKVGAASYLQLLDAQRQFQQARINLVQAQAARYADTAALFQALGGGWWNRPAAVPVNAAAETP
ncbi:MAG TPA: efflux transporter outer membrane subunit [Burkholderiales bacterium]